MVKTRMKAHQGTKIKAHEGGPGKRSTLQVKRRLGRFELTLPVNLVGCESPRPSLLYKGWEGRRSRSRNTRTTKTLARSTSRRDAIVAPLYTSFINTRQAGSRVLPSGGLNLGKSLLVSRRYYQRYQISLPNLNPRYRTMGFAVVPPRQREFREGVR